ncbi:MAG TPA: hypothetical protein DCQ31_05615, partial [Bacteroidales bacterium]|nr:hypothetical protein [Bacteroidales bacterium]
PKGERIYNSHPMLNFNLPSNFDILNAKFAFSKQLAGYGLLKTGVETFYHLNGGLFNYNFFITIDSELAMRIFNKNKTT